MQWQVVKIFSAMEKPEGEEGLGLVGFGAILAETIIVLLIMKVSDLILSTRNCKTECLKNRFFFNAILFH